MPKRTTIRDVALKAGVSFQTVSLALNHPEKVADATLAKVQAAIRALDFVPSLAARSMRQIRTKTLACIFFGERASYDNRSYQIQDTYWNNVLQMLSMVADRSGYALLQRHIGGDPEQATSEIAGMYSAGRIDGMIAVVEKPAHPVLVELRKKDLPFVVFGTRDPKMPHVVQANEDACAAVVRHLHEQGRERIAFISGERDGHVNEDINERTRGFRRAMKECGLSVTRRWQLAGDWSMASGYRIAQLLCGQDDRPDSLIFASDRMALGALKGLHDIGVRVPLDVCVVGFDNMQMDEFSVPPLSSVHSPVLEMASWAISTLLHRIETGAWEDGAQREFPAELVVRDSSRIR
ncbi:MAG TPA: LacI family DNA-binding transcriptional regulator [Burkholderiaceae bacterium]